MIIGKVRVLVFWAAVVTAAASFYIGQSTLALILIICGVSVRRWPIDHAPSTQPGISFWQTLTPLPECRKCFRTMLFGVALLFASVLIVMLMRDSDKVVLIAMFVSLPLMLVGALMLPSYMRCLLEYGKRYSSPNK